MRRVLILLIVLLTACSREVEWGGPARPPAGDPSALRTFLDQFGSRREAVLVKTDSSIRWTLEKPFRGNLRFDWTTAGERSGDVVLSVEIVTAEGDRRVMTIDRRHEVDGERRRSFAEDVAVEVRQPSTITLRADTDVLFSDLRLVQPSAENHAAIVMLWDTARRDAFGLYGSTLPTTPGIDRIFGRATVVQRAYAPASWTIPSTASVMTGLVPESMQDAAGSPVGIPAGVRTMADDFRDAGWSTGGFIGNPTLNVNNGFDRGFTTFYTPPYLPSSMEIPGAEMTARIAEWTAARRGEKFFLYIHYIDPHEPYGPPDRQRGKTPFNPAYSGTYNGSEGHYQLTFDLQPSPADIQHLHRLYLDDVRYLDSVFQRLWNSFAIDLRSRATILLTSDHGEEFYEHRGWKHGPGLYDEVLRIPFLLRQRDGAERRQLPADRLVSLIDVLPTMLSVMNVELKRKVDGVDVFSAEAARRSSLPPVTMLTGGPARAAVVDTQTKLFFFDRYGTRGVPDAAKDPMGHRTAEHLRTIFPSLAAFDLKTDAAELKSTLPARAELLGRWRDVESAISHSRQGIELRFLGGATGSVRIVITPGRAGVPAEGFSLEEGDRLAAGAKQIELQLATRDGDVDGVLLNSADAQSIQIQSDTCMEVTSRTSLQVAAGATARIDSRDVPPSIPRLETRAGTCLAVFLWRTEPRAPVRSPEEESEATRKLRALGYVH